MKEISPKDLPIIDWEDAIRLAGHKKELARDLLDMLAEQLPKELQTIHQLYKDKNYLEMQKAVHKLHGAVCYTGTPRLKLVLSTLETSLKSHIMGSSSSLLSQLDAEVDQLLEHISITRQDAQTS